MDGQYARCGGTLTDILVMSNYRFERYTFRETQSTTLLYPEGIKDWFPVLFHTIHYHSYRRGKKSIDISLIIDKKDFENWGFAFRPENKIVIFISKNFYANLLRSKPDGDQISHSVGRLMELIWHEFYHIKGNKGLMNITPKEPIAQKIVDTFWSWMDMGGMDYLLNVESG